MSAAFEKFLNKAFKDAKLELEEISAKTSSRNRGVPIITFCVSKYVKLEVELPKTLKLEADDGAEEQEGMICMGQLCSGTEVTSMPCLHLRKWLNISHMCPLCRFLMPTDD